MGQENNETTWFEQFDKNMNVIFTEEDFRRYLEIVSRDMEIFGKYLKPGARILDLCMGLGCTAVPMSYLGFKVTGIDNDSRVIEAAKVNAKNFGKDMTIFEGDIFKLEHYFKPDEFDACITGGVLEHFEEDEIKEMVRQQLKVAPLVIASMPVVRDPHVRHLYKDYDRRIGKDGIYRNYWTPDYWLNNIFGGFSIVEHHTAGSAFFDGYELTVVIRR